MSTGCDDYAVARQTRLDMLTWALREIQRLQEAVTAGPDDQQARADARLILEAVEEVITGRKPRSISSGASRFTRVATEEEWARLGDLRALRQQMPRSPIARRERRTPPSPPTAGSDGPGQMAAAAWAKLVRYAALQQDEAEALRMHLGLGWSMAETAKALGLSAGTSKRRVASGLQKLHCYLASRQWRSAAVFINES